LFHTLSELFSIVIAFAIFAISWNSRQYLENNFLLFIGIAYLFVAGLDLAHTIAYKDMRVLIGYDSNLPAQLWIATRYLQSISLLVAPLFFRRKLNAILLLNIYAIASALILISIFWRNVFPDCYIEGSGLTPFKVISEYVISFILLASIFTIMRRRREFDPQVLTLIVWSVVLTIVSELTLTVYEHDYDFFNLIGHLFKIISFYLVYKAIIETGLSKPHNLLLRSVKQSEERFRAVAQTAADAIISIDGDGKIIFWNHSARDIFGFASREMIGNPLITIVPQRYRDAYLDGLRRSVATGRGSIIGKTVETVGLNKDGREFPIELSMAKWKKNDEQFFTGIIRDISRRKKAEEALKKAQSELELRVQMRTSELMIVNERLKREIQERQKAEEALRESETKYRIVADNTYDWEWWVNPEGQFIYMSPSCKKITGYDPERFILEKDLISKIIHPDDIRAFNEHQKEIDDTLAGGEVEFRVVRPDGTARWISHVCQPVYDESKNFLGHRGSNRDITQRKSMEEDLRESEQRLRLLSSRLLTIQEDERKRIARELHDSIKQTLASIKFGLDSRLSRMEKNKVPEGISLESIIALVQDGLDESERIQMELRPSILDDLGLIATLNWFTRQFREVYPQVTISWESRIDEQSVPADLKITIFRIVQEAFNNVVKHSNADSIRLLLIRIDSTIELRVEDNGNGFDPGAVRKGLGLISMMERAELSGGSFAIDSARGRGTIIRATWPL